MSNSKNGRVLNRMGARELTREEIESISGSSSPVITFTTMVATLPGVKTDPTDE